MNYSQHLRFCGDHSQTASTRSPQNAEGGGGWPNNGLKAPARDLLTGGGGCHNGSVNVPAGTFGGTGSGFQEGIANDNGLPGLTMCKDCRAAGKSDCVD